MCVAPPVCLVSLFTRKQGLTVPKATAFPYYDLAHQTSNLVCALVVNFLVRGGYSAKRCRTCGLLKFGRQGPGVKMPVAAVRA